MVVEADAVLPAIGDSIVRETVVISVVFPVNLYLTVNTVLLVAYVGASEALLLFTFASDTSMPVLKT